MAGRTPGTDTEERCGAYMLGVSTLEDGAAGTELVLRTFLFSSLMLTHMKTNT